MSQSAEADARAPELRVGRRIPIEEFNSSATLACIDGRHDGPIVGAPGGDAGEFLLLLAALEKSSGLVFSQPEVLAILEAYMENEGRFYLHTDRAALDALDASLRDLGISSWESARNRGVSIEEWIADPPVGARPLLLRLLIEPPHVGCGHLKTMLEHPSNAGVRRGLVEAVIQAFLQMLWRGGAEPDFVVLEGTHTEEAIVVVEGFGDVSGDQVPEIEPAAHAPAIFVVHMPIRRALWRRNLELFAGEFEFPDADLGDLDVWLRDIASLAERQLGVTVDALAPSLPIWKASVTGTSVEVSRA
jgi:hypothetical protein